MRYCIFGFNKEPKVAKAVNNLSPNPTDYHRSLAKFIDLYTNREYKYIYFLVDFGEIKENPIFKSISMDYFNLTMVPWLLLSKYEAETDSFSNPVVHKVHLKMKGFSETYNDIIKGIGRFDHYLEKEYQSELYCDIFDKESIYITSCSRMYTKKKHNLFKYCNKYYLNKKDRD